MAGLYIHIPFCKKVCYYCDFHFVASLKYKDRLLRALHLEIEQRGPEWAGIKFNTLYFGGGTPSVLSMQELNGLIDKVYENYSFAENIELTLEANPDDLTKAYLEELKQETPVNRLSIGVQSFHDDDLKFINRRHDGKLAIQSLERAKKLGFDNITLDLIYGIPGLSADKWKKNLDLFHALEIPHLAAYHLGIEPKTVFGVWKKRNRFKEISEELSSEHYRILVNRMKDWGFEHYEISNFAKDGCYSEHNKGYWSGAPYLGLGPSAHSYNGYERRWNVANNTKYSEMLETGQSGYFEAEELTIIEAFNDYLITSLRTMWGADLDLIQKNFGDKYAEHCSLILKKYAHTAYFMLTNNRFRFSEQGWFISDSLLVDFILEKE